MKMHIYLFISLFFLNFSLFSMENYSSGSSSRLKATVSSPELANLPLIIEEPNLDRNIHVISPVETTTQPNSKKRIMRITHESCETCCICLEPLIEDYTCTRISPTEESIDANGVLHLTCEHKMHVACAYGSFESNQSACPLCRRSITPTSITKLNTIKRHNKAYKKDKTLFFGAIMGLNNIIQDVITGDIDTRITIINTLDKLNRNVLMYAIIHGQEHTANWLLTTTPIYVDTQDQFGMSALMMAAQYSYTNIAQKLLAKGANPMLSNHVGETALVFALKNNNVELIAILEEALANYETKCEIIT